MICNWLTIRNAVAAAVVGLGGVAPASGWAEEAAALESVARQAIEAIERAHGGAAYDQQGLVQATYGIRFGPMRFGGTMWFTPSMDRIRLEMEDVAVMGYDGETAWMLPATEGAEVPGPPARFHLFTWPYFAAVPFKLDDPGTRHEDAGVLPVMNPDDLRRGTRVTFGEGVGDAPEDWYIAFADPESGRLAALAYIVTYSKSAEEAEESPSVIVYSDDMEVEGVWLARTWAFHHWDSEGGIRGEAKGSGKLSDLRFVPFRSEMFERPEGAVVLDPPGRAE